MLQYDWVVLTRSDYTYLCSITKLDLQPDTIYIPYGEQYGGLTDRFAIFPSRLSDVVLNATYDLVTNVPYWVNWTLHDDPNRTHVNIEQILKQVIVFDRAPKGRLIPGLMYIWRDDGVNMEGYFPIGFRMTRKFVCILCFMPN